MFISRPKNKSNKFSFTNSDWEVFFKILISIPCNYVYFNKRLYFFLTTSRWSPQPTNSSCFFLDEIMQLVPKAGPDSGCTQDDGPTLTRWYYDSSSGKCESFGYKGYGGNANRFFTELECQLRTINGASKSTYQQQVLHSYLNPSCPSQLILIHQIIQLNQFLDTISTFNERCTSNNDDNK